MYKIIICFPFRKLYIPSRCQPELLPVIFRLNQNGKNILRQTPPEVSESGYRVLEVFCFTLGVRHSSLADFALNML